MKKVIVIGSGFAGLAAASALAQNGYQVSVFEKNKNIGGRARTFRSDRFTFDMGPSWYWMPDVFEAFFARFGNSSSDHYDLRLLEPSYRLFFGPDDLIDIPNTPNELFGLFESMETGSSVQLKKFLRGAAYKYEVGMRSLVYKPGKSLLEFADLRLLSALFKMHIFRSLHDHVRKYFSEPRLLKIMEFPILFLGATPQNTPALYSLMNHAALTLGTWYPMGGMHKIIAGMATLAQSLGVDIRTDEPIKQIVVASSKATGVQTEDRLYAADAVIAGADYHHVEQALLAPEYRTYDEDYWQSRVMAPSSLIFYLGLNKKMQNLQHHNLFFDADFDVHADEIYANPSWPTRPLFYVCCPSKTDDSVAPDGCENLFILMPIAADLKDGAEIRELYYHRLISRLEFITGEQVAPHVIFKRSYCVNDFRSDYHAFRGNAYGLANTLGQTAILKPSLNSKKIKNLFFAGQLTVPGPGVPPSLISGQIAANEAVKYLESSQ